MICCGGMKDEKPGQKGKVAPPSTSSNLKEPLVSKHSNAKVDVEAATKLKRRKRGQTEQEAMRAAASERTHRHMKEIEEMDLTRWVILFVTAILSSSLSFVIDEFTFYFGEWRTRLTNDQTLLTVVAVDCAAVALATLIARIEPKSIGSGFPEMKAMLFGKDFFDWLSWKVLIVKGTVLGLVVGAGLPLGKEGPNVHMAACISKGLGPHFYEEKVWSTEQAKRDHHNKATYLLLACCAVGVGSTFSAPIGGVIFAMELMLPQTYDSVAYWGCFLSSVSGAFMYSIWRTATSGSYNLLALLSTNVDPNEGATSARPVTLALVNMTLGAICGVLGAYWVKIHSKVGKRMKAWRERKTQCLSGASDSCKAWLKWRDVGQVVFLTVLNTVLAAQLPLLAGKPQPALLSSLFDKNLIINQGDWNLEYFGVEATMLLCLLMKFWITMMAMCLPVATGVVAPTMIIGALVGRLFGLLMPQSLMDFLLSYPGMTTAVTDEMRGALMARYAIVGAAAFSTAVCRTFAMAITIYEVLCLPNSLIPLCSSCLVSIFVANQISFPFFDMNLIGRGLEGIAHLTHSDRAHQPAELAMRPLHGEHDCLEEFCRERDIVEILKKDEKIQHFGIMTNVECKVADEKVASVLKGSVTRTDLKKILTDAPRKSKETIHLLQSEFTMPREDEHGAITLPLVSMNPVVVPPSCTLKDIYIIMKAMDADVVYVLDQNELIGVLDQERLLGHKL